MGVIAKSFKRLSIAILLALVAGLLIGALCFHNDRGYDYIHKVASPYCVKHFDVNLAGSMEAMAACLDLKGLLKRVRHGVSDENRIQIKIEESQLNKLTKFLAKSPVKKKWFKATVNLNGIDLPAKLKLHGTDPVHHSGGKFSFTIKLSSDSILVDGARRFKLIKGEEADPTVIAINELAYDMGLISTYGRMVLLEINGDCKGDYYLVEDISKEFLERQMGITNYTELSHVSDWSRKDYMMGKGHITDLDLYGEHLEDNDDQFFTQGVERYNQLSETVRSEDIEGLKSMFDLDYMARYLALASIFNDVHFMSGDNLKLIYDFSRGKFYPIYRAEFPGHPHPEGDFSSFPNLNQMMFGEDLSIYDNSITKLFILLLADDEFRQLRDEHLIKIVKNRSDLLGSISNTYARNENVMLRSERTRRKYERQKFEELKLVYNSLYFATEYLDYCHVYGTYDSTRSIMKLNVESFVPVQINMDDSIILKEVYRGMSFGKNLTHNYHPLTLNLDQDKFRFKDIYLVNLVNGDTMGKHIHLNHGLISENDWEQPSQEENETVALIVYAKGTHVIKEDVHIDGCEKEVRFEAGARLKLDAGVNFSIDGSAVFAGTENEPVVIESNTAEPFGTFNIIGCSERSAVTATYLNVSGGGESFVNGRLFTGQFAIYNSNVSLSHCHFFESMGDDGLNIKYSKVELDYCKFTQNMADQVDLDFCCASVTNSVFEPSNIDDNGDGLDLSGSFASISNCSFTGFLDKGLSLGEKSKVLVSDCFFDSNNIAVAIKDQTKVYSWNNSFKENRSDYTSYIKKSFFTDPSLSLVEQDGLKLNLIQEAPSTITSKQTEGLKNDFQNYYNSFIGNTFISSKIDLDRKISQSLPQGETAEQ